LGTFTGFFDTMLAPSGVERFLSHNMNERIDEVFYLGGAL
jgi:hypothetical protein